MRWGLRARREHPATSLNSWCALTVVPACGSEQITPIIERANAQLLVRNVDEDPELAMEFGDRVPVFVLDDEEFACWEVDNDELEKALTQ